MLALQKEFDSLMWTKIWRKKNWKLSSGALIMCLMYVEERDEGVFICARVEGLNLNHIY